MALINEVVDLNKLTFSLFTDEEIKNLSVLKITTNLSFDALGNPLKGGLYDPILGSFKGEPCKTCFKGVSNCLGHFGHIELVLPVINPLFHKIVYLILSNSCLQCHRFQLERKERKMLDLKLKLVKMGLITDALDINCAVFDLMNSESNSTENEILKKYSELFNSKNEHLKLFSNKNIYKMYDKFLTETIKGIKHNSCIFCKNPLTKLNKQSNNKLIFTVFTNENNKLVRGNTTIVTNDIKVHIQEIWKNDKEIIENIAPVLKTLDVQNPVDVFFFNVITVPPPNVRPINKVHDQLIEHPQTLLFKEIIESNCIIRNITHLIQMDSNTTSDIKPKISDEVAAVVENLKGDTFIEKLYLAWQDLQFKVDQLLSSNDSTKGEGLKQIIEKKEGIIRLHMMGKRVNFAARSVITPDPNLDICEIGVPEAIAMKLTYPIPVTSWNVDVLRKLVINGPNVHPGACTIENEDGKIISIPSWSKSKREGLAMRLLTPEENGVIGTKKVNRHLMNGDMLLLNRQPTLHKPSIMAHQARILKGEKTFRLHYANCKAYNADFDGDEMNAHFPQNEISRSEAFNIMNVNNQYLVPKDGTPLSGLIQDHIISGVLLTVRGKFFTKYDYQQLVYQGLSHMKSKIKLLPPVILKPKRLWSGKQIISTLIINTIPKGREPLSLIGKAKIGSDAWQLDPKRSWLAGGTPFSSNITMSESEVIIRHGEMLSGVLDKSQFGATPYGLIHCCNELYGGHCSSTLLSAFSKLFTYYLQWEGFTLGVKDILVISTAEYQRTNIIKECRTIGDSVAAETLGLETVPNSDELVLNLENACNKDVKFRSFLDRKYKLKLDKFTNNINKTCLPKGLLTQFPLNNLQLMVQSGAKGSTVNTMQISCLLGQIELEGKRPPLMISGRSLPSFPPFETSPRAGGFIDGRFMTGIQPQEFFFHCMAGREGLIDTAVKTSKSGYLQRCLIKHLEGITIKYDSTVRDSDDSIVQFSYGEDGMDVSKVQFLNEKQLSFLDMNTTVILNKDIVNKLKNEKTTKEADKHNRSIKKWFKRNERLNRFSPFSEFSKIMKETIDNQIFQSYYDGRNILTCNLIAAWESTNIDMKKDFINKSSKKCPDPAVSFLSPDCNFGVINEKLLKLVENYLGKRDSLNIDSTINFSKSDFKDMIYLKAMQSLAPPGEPVGLLAAQSIGEPSTQMTLNTFHFAGRGDMNVTLGIPRLREILMTASAKLKTPTLDIPFQKNIPDLTEKAEKLQKRFCRVTVESVLHEINVHFEVKVSPKPELMYTLNFKFLPREIYKDDHNVTPKQIIRHMENIFFKEMFKMINKVTGSKEKSLVETKIEKIKNIDKDDESSNENKTANIKEEDSSEEEQENEDDGNTQTKIRKRHAECHEYDDPESEEEEHSDVENTFEGNQELEDEGFGTDDMKPDEHSINVINTLTRATEYNYDKQNYKWCTLSFDLPINCMKIDLAGILKSTAKNSIIREVTNIKRAILYTNNSDELVLKSEGINIIEMFKYDNLLNLNKLYSNDIHAIANTYGIEAACRVIVKEVQNVFGVYGIKVDIRHLSLVADYMTFNGVFEPMSRKGMESSSSPLQQMSFESSLAFLKEAVIKGKSDALRSVSGCLMVGKPCVTGTGGFSLFNSYDKNNL